METAATGWSVQLSEPIALKDGVVLRTLGDASAVLGERRAMKPRPSVGLDTAVVAVREAAISGDPVQAENATRLVELMLQLEGLVLPDTNSD